MIGKVYLPMTPPSTGGTTPPVTANTEGFLVRYIDICGSVIKSEYVVTGGSSTPPTPSARNYLTFAGWNRSTDNIQYNKDIGATYNTTDGKTYIFIQLSGGTGSTPSFNISKDNNFLMTIDWGDGTTTSQSASTGWQAQSFSHQYSELKSYVISIGCEGPYILKNTEWGKSFMANQYAGCVTTVYMGSNVSIPADPVFIGLSGMTCITLPSGLTTSLPEKGFQYCTNLGNINIPAGINSIGNVCFSYCTYLTNYTFPVSITAYADELFNRCPSLTAVSMPDNVTSMGSSIFKEDYSIHDVRLSNSLSVISPYTFSNCVALNNITIPSSVTSIGTDAFNGCLGIRSFIFQSNTPPTWGNNPTVNNLAKFYVPDAYVTTYKNASTWSAYASQVYPISSKPA